MTRRYRRVYVYIAMFPDGWSIMQAHHSRALARERRREWRKIGASVGSMECVVVTMPRIRR